MKGYKVFNKAPNDKLRCRNYVFDETSVNIVKGIIEPCDNGFHFCEKLDDCFNYYNIFNIENYVVCEVESVREYIIEDDKIVCSHLKILNRIQYEDILSHVKSLTLKIILKMKQGHLLENFIDLLDIDTLEEFLIKCKNKDFLSNKDYQLITNKMLLKNIIPKDFNLTKMLISSGYFPTNMLNKMNFENIPPNKYVEYPIDYFRDKIINSNQLIELSKHINIYKEYKHYEHLITEQDCIELVKNVPSLCKRMADKIKTPDVAYLFLYNLIGKYHIYTTNVLYCFNKLFELAFKSNLIINNNSYVNNDIPHELTKYLIRLYGDQAFLYKHLEYEFNTSLLNQLTTLQSKWLFYHPEDFQYINLIHIDTCDYYNIENSKKIKDYKESYEKCCLIKGKIHVYWLINYPESIHKFIGILTQSQIFELMRHFSLDNIEIERLLQHNFNFKESIKVNDSSVYYISRYIDLFVNLDLEEATLSNLYFLLETKNEKHRDAIIKKIIKGKMIFHHKDINEYLFEYNDDDKAYELLVKCYTLPSWVLKNEKHLIKLAESIYDCNYTFEKIINDKVSKEVKDKIINILNKKFFDLPIS